jgi:hypothetical protein
MAQQLKVTTDHKQIKQWVEDHDGRPAMVIGPGTQMGGGAVNIFFPDHGKNDQLEEITWNEFFDRFEENDLEFLYKDEATSDGESRYFKIIER